MTADPTRDPFEPRIVRQASGVLREFNLAGVLSAADVHVARELASLAGEGDESVALAAALAVRGPRLGHVLVDLETIRETAAVDGEEPVDLATLGWPAPAQWLELLERSPLVGEGSAVAPLRLEGSRLYLDRYWVEEEQVAKALLAMAEQTAGGHDPAVLADGIARLFAAEPDGPQSAAAAAAVRRRLAVVAGGPGTGKTTTVARIVALLCEQAFAAGRPAPLIALAAPTGKAAARLQEAVHAQAAELDVAEPLRAVLLELRATTIHRLLGWLPSSNSRFRHNRNQRLPHDVVIIDETSMVSLSLMARLLEALRAASRLVLVGDPGQLASIEAGAVLGDIVGPAAVGAAAGTTSPGARGSASAGGFGAGIVVLEHVHRFGGGIAQLATAIRLGDDDATIELLRSEPEGVRWIDADAGDESAIEPVRERALEWARALLAAARTQDAAAALATLRAFRILCAHRRGPYGVASWTARIEGWLQSAADGPPPGERWFVGRPLLVTENDYELGLNNGDTGIVVRRGERPVAVFERGSGRAEFSPSRLGAIQTVYAMTIHKSQGSQFDAAAVLLPQLDSRILTRELLYTAATRAQSQLTVVGSEETIRAAVRRPVARASGLRAKLWGPGV